MTGMEIYEDARTVSRADLAGWLRQLANQLETGGQIFYGAAGAVTVADQVECELEIEREDGEITVEIEFTWASPVAADSEGTSSAAETAEGEQIEEKTGEAEEADKEPAKAVAGDDTSGAQSTSATDNAADGDAEPAAKA